MTGQLIPARVREEVLERDGGLCRVCGRWLTAPGLHHIVFKSQGGLDVVNNLITIGWTPLDCDCHSRVAHGAKARMWREIFQTVVETPGASAFQIYRWGQ